MARKHDPYQQAFDFDALMTSTAIVHVQEPAKPIAQPVVVEPVVEKWTMGTRATGDLVTVFVSRVGDMWQCGSEVEGKGCGYRGPCHGDEYESRYDAVLIATGNCKTWIKDHKFHGKRDAYRWLDEVARSARLAEEGIEEIVDEEFDDTEDDVVDETDEDTNDKRSYGSMFKDRYGEYPLARGRVTKTEIEHGDTNMGTKDFMVRLDLYEGDDGTWWSSGGVHFGPWANYGGMDGDKPFDTRELAIAHAAEQTIGIIENAINGNRCDVVKAEREIAWLREQMAPVKTVDVEIAQPVEKPEYPPIPFSIERVSSFDAWDRVSRRYQKHVGENPSKIHARLKEETFRIWHPETKKGFWAIATIAEGPDGLWWWGWGACAGKIGEGDNSLLGQGPVATRREAIFQGICDLRTYFGNHKKAKCDDIHAWIDDLYDREIESTETGVAEDEVVWSDNDKPKDADGNPVEFDGEEWKRVAQTSRSLAIDSPVTINEGDENSFVLAPSATYGDMQFGVQLFAWRLPEGTQPPNLWQGGYRVARDGFFRGLFETDSAYAGKSEAIHYAANAVRKKNHNDKTIPDDVCSAAASWLNSDDVWNFGRHQQEAE